MAKRRPDFTLYSFGEYSKWDKNSHEIPKIKNITTKIEAETGTEFGYVLEIKHAKGETITFNIEHPPFKDEKGNIVPPFTGEQFIRTNNYTFYLGDCIWEPVEDKLGQWELSTYYKGQLVAHKKFHLKSRNV
jgi:hypothetical protein